MNFILNIWWTMRPAMIPPKFLLVGSSIREYTPMIPIRAWLIIDNYPYGEGDEKQLHFLLKVEESVECEHGCYARIRPHLGHHDLVVGHEVIHAEGPEEGSEAVEHEDVLGAVLNADGSSKEEEGNHVEN